MRKGVLFGVPFVFIFTAVFFVLWRETRFLNAGSDSNDNGMCCELVHQIEKSRDDVASELKQLRESLRVAQGHRNKEKEKEKEKKKENKKENEKENEKEKVVFDAVTVAQPDVGVKLKECESNTEKIERQAFFARLNPVTGSPFVYPTAEDLDKRTQQQGTTRVVDGKYRYDCTAGECALGEYPVCRWSGGPYPYLPKKDSPYNDYIRLLNWLGVTYWIKGGGLLGAVRHGGQIPYDGDIDVVVPMWENWAMCDDRKGPHIAEGDRLCAMNRDDWVRFSTTWMTDHMKSVPRPHPKLKKVNFSISSRTWGGFRLGPLMDFVVSIYDDMLLKGKRDKTGGLCRAEYSGVEVLALDDAHRVMREQYGPNYMKPDRNLDKRFVNKDYVPTPLDPRDKPPQGDNGKK